MHLETPRLAAEVCISSWPCVDNLRHFKIKKKKLSFELEARLASDAVPMGTNKLIMTANGLERPTADEGTCKKVGDIL